MHLQQNISKYSVFFLSENTSSNKSHQSKIISYLQGREQEYLISCNLLVISFVLVLTCKDKDKESNISEPPLKLPVRNQLEPFLITYLVLLSSSHLQLLLELGLQSPRSDEPSKCKGCIPLLRQTANTAGEDATHVWGKSRENTTSVRGASKASENDTLKHVETSATNMC
ncbi:hypothetical protein ACFX1W_041120 [Malus domestica]